MAIKIPFELDPDFDSFHTKSQQMVRKLRRQMTTMGSGASGGGIMDSLFFPRGGKMNNFVNTDLKRNFDQMFRTMHRSVTRWKRKMSKAMNQALPVDELMNSAKKAGKTFDTAFRSAAATMKNMGAQAKAATAQMKSYANAASKAARAAQSAAGGAGRGGAGARTLFNAPPGRYGNMPSSSKAKGRARGFFRGGGYLGAMGARGIFGMLTSGFQEAINTYEQREMARLQAAPTLMGRGGRYSLASGADLGYNQAQVAEIQGRAAQLGLGRGANAGRLAMEMQRGYGSGMVDVVAGIQRRAGTTIDTKQQLSKARNEITRVFGAAVASGLKTSRMLEFTQAATNFAEKQLEITPDKDSFKEYTKQLAFVQGRGGAGLLGKYGAAALGKIDARIKGAGGAQEAFLNRAFGFGAGASYLDVTRRREAGIGDPRNISDIMTRLQKEYGSGQFGGLSAAGLFAFKGMGFGSTTMAEKFGQMYLGPNATAGGMTAGQQKKEIDKIMSGGKDSEFRDLRKRAYQAMANFGRPARVLAKRFDDMAKLGEKWYDIKIQLMKVSTEIAKAMAPFFKKVVGPLAKKIATFVKNNAKTLTNFVQKVSNILQGGINGIIAFVKTIAGGRKKGEWFTTKVKRAFKNALKAAKKPSQLQYESDVNAILKKDPRAKKAYAAASRALKNPNLTDKQRDAIEAFQKTYKSYVVGKNNAYSLQQGLNLDQLKEGIRYAIQLASKQKANVSNTRRRKIQSNLGKPKVIKVP